MDNLFLLLFLASFVALIVGLIRPTAFSRLMKGGATRKKAVAIFGIAALVFFVLFGMTTDPVQQANTDSAASKTTPNQVVLESKFDVPSLVGKNLDEIVAALGVPNKDNSELTPQQLELGASEWSKSYEKDGRELLITYNLSTKKVIDFFIPSIDNEDKQHLLSVGNLKENDSRYTVEFVKALKDPSTFTGVKVTPK